MASKCLELFNHVRAIVARHSRPDASGSVAGASDGRAVCPADAPLFLNDLSDRAPWTTALASVLRRTLVPGATFDLAKIGQCAFDSGGDVLLLLE